jgi:hypothetical protein
MKLLIAGLWQHLGPVGTAAMADLANHGNVQTDTGAGVMTMAWIGFTLQAVVMLGLLAMILSIIVLDRMTDND